MRSILSDFGDYGINSMSGLEANGWTLEGINDFQVCGLGGCTAGWCGNPCSGTEEYAGFWCGGGCAGSISYPLPSGYNRGLIQIGVSYTNPSCHGTVTVGDQTLFDDNGGIGNDVMKLEFMYNEVPRSTRKHATNRPLTPSLCRVT